MDCIFCKILKGEIPARKIFENEKFVAILDAFPANEGHCLVIPKEHFQNIFEIDEETLMQGYKIAKSIAEKIKKVMKIENINILQNNGPLASQSVNHFHIHIIPRKADDGVTIKSEVVKIEEDKMNEIAKELNFLI